MSAAAARPPTLGGVARRTRDAAARDDAALSVREAALRSAATAGLAGIALILGLELAPVVAQSAVLGALLLGGMAVCVAAGLALVAATASASRAAWRAVAASATVVLAAWALPHAVGLPAPAGARGDWAAMPGVACAGLAAMCLALAAAAGPATRVSARGLAVALALLVAWAPGAAAFVVATGPGPPGGDATLSAGSHVHGSPAVAEPVIVRRRGRHGDHFVTRVPAAHRSPPAGVALLGAAAGVFVAGAAASLRRRTATMRSGPAS